MAYRTSFNKLFFREKNEIGILQYFDVKAFLYVLRRYRKKKFQIIQLFSLEIFFSRKILWFSQKNVKFYVSIFFATIISACMLFSSFAPYKRSEVVVWTRASTTQCAQFCEDFFSYPSKKNKSRQKKLTSLIF